jgi:ATP synthase protein I
MLCPLNNKTLVPVNIQRYNPIPYLFCSFSAIAPRLFYYPEKVSAMKDPLRGKKKNPDRKGDLLWASTLGINLVVATAAGVVIGWYLDKLFKTSPVLTIIFFFIGTFAGFRQIYREIKKLEREDKNNEQR